MVASLVAVGVFISSLFNSQVVVFLISLAIVLFFWLVRPPSTATGISSQILTYLNFIDHYLNFYRGTIDLSDIVYYLSLTSLALFLGTMSVEIRRWR
jgi:ABC-2 type transport system permease protein